MRRVPQAFLNDVIDAGNAIIQAVHGISLEEYEQNRLIRSSVEREFILIGEALKQLSQQDDALFASIEEAPQIIAFRNKLTHEYIKVSNRLVWGVIKINLPRLIERCSQLLHQLDRGC